MLILHKSIEKKKPIVKKVSVYCTLFSKYFVQSFFISSAEASYRAFWTELLKKHLKYLSY